MGSTSDLLPSKVSLKRGFHPIIFVEIDDSSLERWGSVEVAAAGTPRSLLASLIHVLREAQPSAIFLDYDFRNHLPDDSALRDELAKPNLTPVLLPRFYGPGVLPDCESQTQAKAPMEQETVFDDTFRSGSVGSAHSIVALGAYGLIEGTCSFYWTRVGDKGELVSRTAAMVRAIELSSLSNGAQVVTYDHIVPRLIPTRWWIRDDTRLLNDKAGQLAYARIKSSFWLREGTLDVTGADLSALWHAIIIISSTHRWSDDVHETPVGDLPGALVQANLALELQSPPEQELPLKIQFLIDLVLVIASALLTIPLCWLPIYRRLPLGSELPIWARISRLAREGLVITIFGVALCIVYVVLVGSKWGVLPGWRFGVLSFLLSGLVVLVVEIVAGLAEAVTKFVEAIMMRIAGEHARSAERAVEASEPPDPQMPS
jgi:hypothetical protein